MTPSLAISVMDVSQVGQARRAAEEWGRSLAWNEDLAGRVALIITELGNNLAIHTSGGTILLRSFLPHDHSGVEIMSLDSGPGVANFAECMREGFSTAGTAGTGLGAVKRASQLFSVHSQPGVGTALLSRLWSHPAKIAQPGKWESGAVNVPLAGEFVSGDSWACQSHGDTMRVMIADGLGHGEFAAEASRKAIEVFHSYASAELPAILSRTCDALRTTRGAALAIAELNPSRRTIAYTGIGNTVANIVTHVSSTSLVSMNGTAGARNPTQRLFHYEWPAGAVFVMHSDGLKSNWQLARYQGLLDRHPALIAGVLYRDFTRKNDDATVLAITG